VFSNTIGKGDTRTRKGTHMGQSFVRVNRVIGEKKKVAPVKSLSLFRREAIEIDVGSNAFRERRLGRAPGTELLEAGAGGSRRADASTVCRRDRDLCGSARPASRVPRTESLRALDILFGGTSACAVDGTRMTESARAYGSRKGGPRRTRFRRTSSRRRAPESTARRARVSAWGGRRRRRRATWSRLVL